MTKITLLKNFNGKKAGAEMSLRAHEARALVALNIAAPSASVAPVAAPAPKPALPKRGTYERRDIVAKTPAAGTDVPAATTKPAQD